MILRWIDEMKDLPILALKERLKILSFFLVVVTISILRIEEAFGLDEGDSSRSGIRSEIFSKIALKNNILNTANNLGVDLHKTFVWGPGLQPDVIIVPARYFYIHFVGMDGEKLSNDSQNLSGDLKIRIDCNGEREVWTQVLNRKDGSFIIRYKVFQTCLSGFRIIVSFRNQNVANSPYTINVPVHSDSCNCPKYKASIWLLLMKCQTKIEQIEKDLAPFPLASVDFEDVLSRAIERFHRPTSHSFCHYALKDNQIYRKCYGEHVGFHIFPDAILLSLSRKMHLADMEFIINLGDWPLIEAERVKPLIPIFSWCKSNKTADILLPTYELTEASLEGMGRVSLDIMTVQSNSDKLWENKIPKLFWRGRDSRIERLDLIKIGRENSDLLNVSLTNFFFFRDKESIYGPKAEHVSFFKFFDFKYQLNIDGTVAAYRFPYLLAGDSVIFKTNSAYVEHFYRDIEPWKHYIPVNAALTDLIEKINWAKNNDEKVRKIVSNARQYAKDNLMPLDVFCYHATLYQEWSKRIKNRVTIHPDMQNVPQPNPTRPTVCDCSPVPIDNSRESKDEL